LLGHKPETQITEQTNKQANNPKQEWKEKKTPNCPISTTFNHKEEKKEKKVKYN
jgi:hypothetical protein